MEDKIDFEAAFRRKLAEQASTGEGESGVVDFDNLLRMERGRSVMSTTAPLKACKVADVFNGLQRRVGDGSRMLSLDVRNLDNWKQFRIRDSELIGLSQTGREVTRFSETDDAFTPFICKGSVIVILVDETSTLDSGGSPIQREVARLIRTTSPDVKVFMLDGGFSLFAKTYPFMCVGETVGPEDATLASMLWPAEVLPQRLYLGTTTLATCKRQLEALGITAIILLDDCEPPDDLGGVELVHLPTEDNPEVRIPLLEGLAALEEHPGPILVACMHGTSLGPALAIAHVMSVKKLPHLQAMAYVMKRKRDVAPHAGAYTQLQELQSQLGLRPF